MLDKLRHVAERFPDLGEIIKQHSADNRFFRSLCEDYGEAVEILREWEASNSGRSSKRADACRDLIADLEQEILLELQNRIDGV
ncbi:hypothetical protein TSH58p_08455 [Azospirillum sp. TSH58]|uniref:hypothetical protein n=1 Tax=Azospirillum sp. TSH58 TaxID=664962 RepID=UPI000D602ED3|nr:hypothetical protein [Azospirillum sp. TSH58]AWJ83553.1 hypothetical protein TSH58p_08455 [Azospirillum sp. TSH58]PWC72355.1 hypothetical protein TSH58_08350 [Azospirillum sp. TSH58]